MDDPNIRLATSTGRWLLFITILGSAIALLDSTAVNVALPSLGRSFHAGITGIQWVVSGYLVTLASLILVGGSFGDIYGRRKIFLIGISIFGITSLVAATAPNIAVLISARLVQGIGGALMTPASLAIIQSSYHPDDRGRAIGAWSGFIGIAAAVGPFVGGWLTQTFSWRYVFVLNLPMVILLWILTPIHVTETKDHSHSRTPDIVGAISASVALGAISYVLIESPRVGFAASTIAAGVVALLSVCLFVARELSARDPMVPFQLFRSRQFSGTNLATFSVYSALGGTTFLVVLQLQESLHYSPVSAGLSLLPLTVLMFLFSARAGALSARIGPRLPMTVGPVVLGLALLGIARIHSGDSYFGNVFPWIVLLGIGLVITVVPLTVTVLAAAPSNQSGIASGINNAVARSAGLLSVAALPFLVGISGDSYSNPARLTHGFHNAMLICALLAVIGGITSWLTVRNDTTPHPAHRTTKVATLTMPCEYCDDKPLETTLDGQLTATTD